VDPETFGAGGMTGREFEDAVARRCLWYREHNLASIGRYGVQAIHTSPTDVITMKSLPDFEGLVGGSPRQIIFDCKVCSQASFDLSPYRDRKKRQLKHMFERSIYGATCGFLIHWNERELTRRTDKKITWWFPVDSQMPFWAEVESSVVRRITRDACEEYGKEMGWTADLKSKPKLLELFTY
jgi:penicillin-binding protein-related factor A (putative recombinase)